MRALARLAVIPLLVLLVSASVVSAQESEAAFSQGELDQMLAPIALYPDALLSQMLMASTYPLEVVEAARWSRDNPGLEGAPAVEAVADQGWDPSVKALVAFPQVLARMNEDLEWTRRLGDAFLYQEAQVMGTIQELRERAYAAGHLDSPDHLRAYREGEAIVIEPASPHTVHVPYYHPKVIYGGWWWPAYPPVYWGAVPGYYAGTLFIWSSAIRVSPGFFFSTFDWPRRHIVIVNVHKQLHKPRFRSERDHARHDGFRKWRHASKHRRGVVYRHETLNRRFGRSSLSGAVDAQTAAPQGGWRRDRESHHGRDSLGRDSSLRKRSIGRTDARRSDAGGAVTRGSGGGHTRFHRTDVNRPTSQRQEAVRGSGNSGAAGGRRPPPGFRWGGGSVRSPAATGRSAVFSR